MRRLARLLAAGLLAGACGSTPAPLPSGGPSTGAPSPSVGPSATLAPGSGSPESPTPDGSGAPQPTGLAGDVEPPGPGWTVASVLDPPLAYALPPYWQQLRIRDFRAELVAAIPQLDGQVKAEYEYLLELVDGDRLHSVALGPSALADFTSTVFVFVEDGDASVEAAVERRLAEEAERLSEREEVDRDHVSLAAGDGMLLVFEAEPEGGAAVRSFEWVVRTADGRTVAIVVTGLRDETPFGAFAAGIAESLLID